MRQHPAEFVRPISIDGKIAFPRDDDRRTKRARVNEEKGRERERERERHLLLEAERKRESKRDRAAVVVQGGRHGIRHCGRLRIHAYPAQCVAPHACDSNRRRIRATAAAPHRRLVSLLGERRTDEPSASEVGRRRGPKCDTARRGAARVTCASEWSGVGV